MMTHFSTCVWNAVCFIYRHEKFRRVLKIMILLFVLLVYTLLIALVSYPKEAHFLPLLTSEEKRQLLELTDVLTRILEKHNVTYFIYAGTLLGSYRHHDLVPWDDDVDILVSLKERKKLYDAVMSMRPDYDLYLDGEDVDDPRLWKFYASTGVPVPSTTFRYPHIDVFGYDMNETHVWNTHPYFTPREWWPRIYVFPLRRRPLGPLNVISPCNSRAVIQQNINDTMCRTRTYNHAKETGMSLTGGWNILCERVRPFTPMVNRSVSKGVTTETLMINGRVVQTKTFKVFPCELV